MGVCVVGVFMCVCVVGVFMCVCVRMHETLVVVHISIKGISQLN